MFVAYCDESYGHGKSGDRPYYVVAGYCARVQTWTTFERYWNATMRELGIDDIGCHASKCSNGARRYDGLAPEERREIQYRLIVDIAASRPMMGFVAPIDLQAWSAHENSYRAELDIDHRKFGVPHIAAMNLCVELVSQILEDVVTPLNEAISFVFDRNTEFGGRAREWFQMSIDRPLMNHHLRLGEFTQSDRMTAVGLQAADLLAYSAYRHLSNPEREGWQWKQLNFASHISMPVIGDSQYLSD